MKDDVFAGQFTMACRHFFIVINRVRMTELILGGAYLWSHLSKGF
ncbi:hypothetical protein MEZE111188_19295 [Mesobacillus zeae]